MTALRITPSISIDESELEESFILSSGAGGQNVNKVSSAVQLRFDVVRSPSLPDPVRLRLIALSGSRLTKDGVLILVGRQYRDQARNRMDVRERLAALIREAAVIPKKRRPTKPTRASKERRLDSKKKHARLKRTRSKNFE
ncbi:MAG TPA: alternative ribosome rescue aminoacyl-tRNA hydrolase ArfB [Rhizomicrobium sp.]|jgi:ribosome-associated protein|nr:alternative ribosome rescue aminoacyl-tRNA hydrolase ArfB [Rhizomicrobium sp.]